MSSQSIVKALKKYGKPGIQYVWADGAPRPVPIETAMQEFNRINAKYEGIDAGNLVYESKPADAVFHKVFPWDDKYAADKYREDLARKLIQKVEVVYIDDQGERTTPPVRAFVAVPVLPEDDKRSEHDIATSRRPAERYVPVVDVLREEDIRRKHIERAYAEYQSWKKRYEDFVEFARVFEEVDRLFAELEIAS